MSGLRRGFRTYATKLAAELRAELGLGLSERIAPLTLGTLYGVPVAGITELDVNVADAYYFMGAASGAWSAVTVFDGPRRLILLNDHHDTARLANSLSHELAHLFLEHEPTPIRHADGTRTWDGAKEAEANELGAQLLLPDPTAKTAALRNEEPQEVADRYGISIQLATWRMNVSGGYQIRMRR